MRLQLLALLFFSLLLLPHCSEQAGMSEENNSAQKKEDTHITGRWKQTADLYSIGDATVHTRYLSDTEHKYLQFNSDSSVETNMQAFTSFKRYSLLKDSSIRFTANDQSISKYRYILAGDSMDIYLMCIEPCGVRLVKER